MSVLSILLGYQLKRRKRTKRVVLKNRCEIFRDNNHQSLYKNIKLYNDIDWNPGPVYANELPLWVHRVLLPPGAFKSQKIILARLACLCFAQVPLHRRDISTSPRQINTKPCTHKINFSVPMFPRTPERTSSLLQFSNNLKLRSFVYGH